MERLLDWVWILGYHQFREVFHNYFLNFKTKLLFLSSSWCLSYVGSPIIIYMVSLLELLFPLLIEVCRTNVQGWSPHNGLFLVKKLAQIWSSDIHLSQNVINWSKWWETKFPPLLWLFGWHIGSNWLPTANILNTRSISVSRSCSICQQEEESQFHLIKNCAFVMTLWF